MVSIKRTDAEKLINAFENKEIIRVPVSGFKINSHLTLFVNDIILVIDESFDIQCWEIREVVIKGGFLWVYCDGAPLKIKIRA